MFMISLYKKKGLRNIDSFTFVEKGETSYRQTDILNNAQSTNLNCLGTARHSHSIDMILPITDRRNFLQYCMKFHSVANY